MFGAFGILSFDFGFVTNVDLFLGVDNDLLVDEHVPDRILGFPMRVRE